MKTFLLAITLLLSLHTCLFAASRVYVDEPDDFSPANPSAGMTVTWKPGTSGAVANLTFGTDAFTSVQSAIDGVDSGGGVFIAAGIFDEGVVITITKAVTVTGDGPGRSILTGGSNGDNVWDPGEHSVLKIRAEIVEGFSVGLRNLSIVDGFQAGSSGNGDGVTSIAASLTIDNCHLSGHHNQAIMLDVIQVNNRVNGPRMRIVDSVVTGNGIGVYNNYGHVGVIRTKITRNRDGILNSSGRLNLISSEVSESSQHGIVNGGASFLSYFSTISENMGAGIYNTFGDLMIYSSTISGNQGSGIFDVLGQYLYLLNSTVVGNANFSTGTAAGGVSIFGGKDILIADSIIAGNSIPDEQAVRLEDVFIVSPDGNSVRMEGVNFIGNGTELSDFRPGVDLSFNSTGTSIDDVLEPALADNGGPTRTHALVAGSPAINAGAVEQDFELLALVVMYPQTFIHPLSFLTNPYLPDIGFSGSEDGSEQRGPDFPRRYDGRLDIGAVEANRPIRVSGKSCSRSENAVDIVFNQEVLIADLAQVSVVNTATGETIPSTASLSGKILTITSPAALAEGNDFSVLIAEEAVTNDFGNSFGVTDPATLSFPVDLDVYVDQPADFFPMNPSQGDTVIWNLGAENEVSGLTFGVNAFSSVQEGVDALCFDGTVFIAGGIYEEEIEIDHSITLRGDAPSTTFLSGSKQHRVLRVFGAENVVNIDRLTIMDGLVGGAGAEGFGGGILNIDATLTVTNAMISGNEATEGGEGSGGGIANLGGTLDVRNSTFSGNIATDNGGAILNVALEASQTSTLTVANSTFSGNETNSPPPTGFNLKGGGAISNITVSARETASVVVNSSTFAENTALNGSGGGISNVGGTLSVRNSIVVENAPQDVVSLSSYDNDNNLIGLPDGLTLTDILEPLADNGGPTPTRALSPGSPAINAGDNSLVPVEIDTDQRGLGFPRIFDGRVDIGAFEALPVPSLVSSNPAPGQRGVPLESVVSLTFDQTLKAGSGVIQIRRSHTDLVLPSSVMIDGSTVTLTPLANFPVGQEFYLEIGPSALLNSFDVPFGGISDATTLSFTTCVSEAYVSAAGDFSPASPAIGDPVTWEGAAGAVPNLVFGVSAFESIQDAIDKTCVGGTIFIATGTYDEGTPIEITKDLTLQGDGAGLTVLSGGGTHRVLEITAAQVTIGSLSMIDGQGDRGGAILNTNGDVTINDAIFSGNQAVFGGGIEVTSGRGGANLAVNRTTFLSNMASSGGGGIRATGSSNITLSGCTLDRNTATGAGGAIAIAAGSILEATNCTISGNSTTTQGGGISSSGTQTVISSTITQNVAADGSGGGLEGGTTTLINSIVAGNLGATSPRDIVGTITSVGGNFIGNTTGVTGFRNGIDLSFASTGTTIDQLLDTTLANNGGPTLTHALLPGSPAFDAGVDANAAGLTFDQRGFPRILGGAVDLGAVELADGITTGSFEVAVSPGLTTKIKIQDLIDGASGGVGTPFTFVSVSDPENAGSSTRISGNYLVYQAGPGQTGPDHFTYVLTDGYQEVTGTIQVNPQDPGNARTINIISVELGDQATIRAAGVPGLYYQMQYSDDLSPDSWRNLGEVVLCPSGGVMEFVDPDPSPETRFYRMGQVAEPSEVPANN